MHSLGRPSDRCAGRLRSEITRAPSEFIFQILFFACYCCAKPAAAAAAGCAKAAAGCAKAAAGCSKVADVQSLAQERLENFKPGYRYGGRRRRANKIATRMTLWVREWSCLSERSEARPAPPPKVALGSDLIGSLCPSPIPVTSLEFSNISCAKDCTSATYPYTHSCR